MTSLPDDARPIPVSPHDDLSPFPPSHPSDRDLIARAIIVRDECLLVNYGIARDGARYYALPGGHVDPGESVLHTLAREFQEELEADISVGELLFVSEMIYGTPARHELVLFFRATLASELREENNRVLSPEPRKDFRWLPMSELADAPLVPPALKAHLLGHDNALYVFEALAERSA